MPTNTKVISLADFVDSKVGKRREFESNVELAKAAKLSESTIRNIRKGKSVSIRTIEKLDAAFPDTSLNELKRMAGLKVEDTSTREGIDRQAENVFGQFDSEYKRLAYNLLLTLLEQQRAGKAINNHS